MMLPPQLQQGANPQQMVLQLQQKLQLMGQEMQKMSQENMQLKSGAQVDMAKIQVDAQAKDKSHQLALAEADSAHQLSLAQADREHQILMDKAQKERELAVWKAKLDAATKIEVAQISAKGTLGATAIKAESDANIALSTALTEDGSSTEGADQVMGSEMTTPIQQMSQMHSEAMDKFNSTFQELAKAISMLAQNNSQPKTIRLGNISRKDDGSIGGATATVQ